MRIALRFQSFVFEKSNTTVIEISSELINENQKIFAISKDAIQNLSTYIEKIKIRFSNYVKCIQYPVVFNLQ